MRSERKRERFYFYSSLSRHLYVTTSTNYMKPKLVVSKVLIYWIILCGFAAINDGRVYGVG